MKQRTGLSIIERVGLGALLLVLVVLFQFMVARQQRSLRDVQRLAIVREAEAAFSLVFVKTGSYEAVAENGCGQAGDLLSICNFTAAGSAAVSLEDPGKESITVTTPPSASGYAIKFVLEGGSGRLAKGEHILTQEGVQ